MMELGICYKYKTLKLHRGLWKRLQLTQPVRATEESAGKKKKKKDYVKFDQITQWVHSTSVY